MVFSLIGDVISWLRDQSHCDGVRVFAKALRLLSSDFFMYARHRKKTEKWIKSLRMAFFEIMSVFLCYELLAPAYMLGVNSKA